MNELLLIWLHNHNFLIMLSTILWQTSMLFFKQPGDNHQINYSNWLTHHSRSGGDTHETISPLYDVLSLFKVEKQRFMSS
jgi:hypothetical protein